MKFVLIGTVSSSIFGFRKLFLQSLVNAGHDVYILTTDLTPELQQRAKDELNVNAEKYKLARTGMNPLADVKNAWALRKRLKELKPDYVFCYFSKPVIWGTLAAWSAGIKNRYGMLEGLGYYFTNDPKGNSNKKRLIRLIQVGLFHFSLPFVKGLIVLNPDDKKDLVEKYRIRVRDVKVLGGIGLDLDEYAYSEPDLSKARFVFVGRLLAEKGINEFLQAAEIVKATHSTAEFVVLGKPDPENAGSVDPAYFESLVEQGVINYPGSVTNVADWLADSSVFVLPSSYREGVPRSTQEAMAVGRPIITTDVPGCRETIEDGKNGFKVPPHNALAVSEAMLKFIKNPDLILTMGLHSRKMAEDKFNADMVNQRLFSFLELD